MKIVLVGYMGSGKTTIGKLLAEALNVKFIDLDHYIEKQLGASIAELFQKKGEIFFRKKEHEYLNRVLQDEEDVVLATGGGTPCYAGNMDTALKFADHVIYLKLTIGELAARLSLEKATRPLIASISEEDMPEFIGKHIFERSPFYSKATHTIQCGTKTPEAILEDISAVLG
ncbi:shikimate kinase [Spongiimicrobium salis]|uniref:shikimate kinase n=1 Tax=Spongiimicrobium salis TaxID=1667022 RepID=UPI00374CB902